MEKFIETTKQLRYRRWCLTVNNYTDAEIQHLNDLPTSYIIVGREIGKEKKTPHLQIYMEFANAKTFSSIKKMMKKAHIEVSKGNAKQNTDYCSKDGDVIIEKGEPFNQGKRNDLQVIKALVKKQHSIRDMIETDSIKSLQGLRMAENLMKYIEKPRSTAPKIIWRYGSAGSGKTRWCYENYTEVFTPINFKWFEGYDGHKTVLLDDLRGDFCKYHEFLKLIDRYPYRVECKGGSRQLLATTIIITSPFHPKDVWNTVEDKDQLLRRIDEIICTDKITQKSKGGNTKTPFDYSDSESEASI